MDSVFFLDFLRGIVINRGPIHHGDVEKCLTSFSKPFHGNESHFGGYVVALDLVMLEYALLCQRVPWEGWSKVTYRGGGGETSY